MAFDFAQIAAKRAGDDVRTSQEEDSACWPGVAAQRCQDPKSIWQDRKTSCSWNCVQIIYGTHQRQKKSTANCFQEAAIFD